MFFFIGGVQPKTVTLEDTPRLCPACGLVQARLRRIDHYLSLFFIPLFPVKRGDPVVICDRCGTASTPDEPMWQTGAPGPPANRCSQCGFVLEHDFKYCPNCGVRL